MVKQHHAYHFGSKLDYQNSLEVLHNAALGLEKMNDFDAALYTYSRAVMACLERDDLDRANVYLNLAISNLEQMKQKDTYALAYYHRALAKFHLRIENYTDCLHHSQLSADMCARMEMHEESAESLKIVADAYRQQGLLESACDIYAKTYELLSKSRWRNNG